MNSDDAIPEEFVGQAPDLDRCVSENCRQLAEYGRLHCMWCLAKFREEREREWRRRY